MYWVIYAKGESQWVKLPRVKTVVGAKVSAAYLFFRRWNNQRSKFVIVYTTTGVHPLKATKDELILIAVRKRSTVSQRHEWYDYDTSPLRERVELTPATFERIIRENVLTKPNFDDTLPTH